MAVDLGKLAATFYRAPGFSKDLAFEEITPSPRTGSMESPKVPPSRYVVFASLALIGGALDLWTKQAIFQWRGLPGTSDIHWVIEGYFGIETAVNIGAVFGMGAGKGMVFATISVIAAIGIVTWLFLFRAALSLWLTVALGFVTGGIIGNLYDRLGMWWQPGYPAEWKSGVRDWILWQASDELKWPNFNIADSLLVTGAIMLVIQSLFFPVPLATDPDGSDDHAPENAGANRESQVGHG